MAASGSPFPSPRACPFVALELDRDRRSERPDYRHRCFAEPTPAPRSIAHQEAYCLSSSFAACPVFQDWAVRAAAAPVGSQVGTPVGQTTAAAGAGAAGGTGTPQARDDGLPAQQPASDEPPPDATPATPVEPAVDDRVAFASRPPGVAVPTVEPPIGEPPLVEPPPLERETVRTPDRSAWDEVSDAEQLSVFGGAAGAADNDEPRSSLAQSDAASEPPDVPGAEAPPDYVAPPSRPAPAARQGPVEDPAVPAFLAGRAPRSTGAASPPPAPRPSERVTREDVVPSWDIDGRYGAVRPDPPRRGGSRLDNMLTAIAVIAILLLGVAGVIFLPGLLGGSPTRSPAASFVPASARPTAAATAAGSATTTAAPRTAAPTVAPSVSAAPVGSPRYYRIKANDSLASIAARFRISVDELLAANPDIVDPNYIQVGQVIVIPRPPDD